MDSNISHELEDRFRNIEGHLGIGKVDEETGEYSVEKHDANPPAPPENVQGVQDVTPEDEETTVPEA